MNMSLITTSNDYSDASQLLKALSQQNSSQRLKVALEVGTYPKPEFIEVLIERCAKEPDFYVRDMLTWAIIRHDPQITVPLLIKEVVSGSNQARSQALHALSKVGDPAGWQAINDDVLCDTDDDVARAAWRAAIVLAPQTERVHVAEILASQLGRGNHDVQLSLSRAIIALEEDSVKALEHVIKHGNKKARSHALATARMKLNPEEGFDMNLDEAKKTMIFSEPKTYK